MFKKAKESRSDAAGGLLFVGSLMTGLGFGLYYGRPDVGVLIGLGVGFVLFGLMKAFLKP